ncbi:hypothetical protein ISF_03976 [Cordyceps fumosorosea ARSEF 2679]|uniref:Uncharacterized protein n=1 Tax=Cordyceps fumosorosea (strain ARSEF 2679) TaxID=1081104 RepID=A0A162KCQ2_CORFA|nr:hypothetical protein ISF_03976 [Cordyceps fumosorosea ARSEF 2679]OAA66138.1 hypothetical protein ISF_03976 [Cordyceps fumosorosea ARSEF 2679]
MAPASKANYKSYEAQARLVRAIVAAHPTTKWNYKEIAACYGSDMTEHALNHRFRHIRAQSEIIMEGRKANLDVKDLTTDESSLPKTVGAVDKQNIAKYFGQSTADGIQFQFRSIKKDADKMRAVADSGGDPSACLDLGSASAAGTASTVTPSSTPKTPRSRGVASMPASGASTGGSRTVKRSRSTAAVKRAGARARPGSLPMHVRNDAGARPSAAFATAASAAPRARASLFGDVPAFRPQPPSTAGKTAGSEFLTGGSGGLSAENSYFDDYDPYEGEI